MNGVGHGAYLVGNNMMIYSHHFKGQNNVGKGISFGTGD